MDPAMALTVAFVAPPGGRIYGAWLPVILEMAVCVLDSSERTDASLSFVSVAWSHVWLAISNPSLFRRWTIVGFDATILPSRNVVAVQPRCSNNSRMRVSNGVPSSSVMATYLCLGCRPPIECGAVAGGLG